MSRPDAKGAASSHALLNAAAPSAAKPMIDLGQAGGKDTLRALEAAVRELKAMAVAPILRQAIAALNREDFVKGGQLAIEALNGDERNGVGWYLLGIARERAGDFQHSVMAYEAALKLLPDHAEVANDLGRLAYRMGMHEQAEKLFRRFMVHAPEKAEGVNNLASVLKDSGRRAEAIQLLKDSIPLHPEAAMLWNTLGAMMLDIGDLENALVFLTEAARLDPTFAKTRHNLSQAKMALGDPAGALVDCDEALTFKATADDKANMEFARSNYLLALGRIGEGWDQYEVRLSPRFPGVTQFVIEAPQWSPGADFGGKDFLIVAEQGLGDEILFANVLPDIVARMRPEGSLRIAIERRLVALFQRSFPQAEVIRHATYAAGPNPARVIPDLDDETVGLWAPMGSLLREHRREASDFPDRVGYLKADPERVAYWKGLLEDLPGAKVGILWKSNISKDHRSRFFSAFDLWEPVLKAPGVTIVNLQYGDCEAELALAKEKFGVDVWSPPGIDLKEDLDDLAALCCAMDLVVGFSNATLNIAAACGVPTWLVTTQTAWTRLGTDGYPWYPQVRVFSPEVFDWGSTMVEVADALAEFATRPER